MTREHKVALIVGFSLILLVAVLISDHLSRARRTQVDDVQPSEVLLAESSLAPTDPLAPIDPPPAQQTLAAAPTHPAPALANPSTPTSNPSIATNAQFHADSPMMLSMGGGKPTDAPLRDAISAAGATIQPGTIPTIVLPPTTPLGTAATNPAPGEQAAPAPLPKAEEAARYHAVQKGDTLYRLAQRYYGSGNQWKLLADANKDQVGANGLLREGTRLRIPAGAAAPHSAPTKPPQAAPQRTEPKRDAAPATKPADTRLAKAKTYTVRRGDTLGDISMKSLGTSRRWREICDLNRLDEDEVLTPGMVLKLPG